MDASSDLVICPWASIPDMGPYLGLAWPCWIYQVLAPEPKLRDMDVFERAVFGLCQAGKRSLIDIGALLELEPELVGVIIALLQHRGWLDSYGVPTQAGMKAWDADSWSTGDVRVGHVLRDPWTGNLWPIFLSDLPEVRCRWRDATALKVELGSHGKAQRLSLLRVPRPTAPPTASPSAREVLEAAETHSRRLRNGQEATASAHVAVRGDGDSLGGLLSRVVVFERPPLPGLLVTGLVISTPEDQPGWAVMDPVKEGVLNTSCRISLTSVLAEHTSFANRVQPFLSRATGNVRVSPDLFSVSLPAPVEDRLDHLPGGDVLRTRWHELSALWRTIDHDSTAAPALVRAVVVESQAVMEELLGCLTREASSNDEWKLLSAGGVTAIGHNERLLEAKAALLGLATPLPRSLVTVARSRVREVLERGYGSLRARMVAAVLQAASQQLHPVRLLASRAPDILSRWDALAALRNRAAHADQPITLAEARTAYDCVQHTLIMLADTLKQAA